MTDARAAAPPAAVPVQLTTIAPVRVFNVHGEFFDTEVDVNAPLQPLQRAIEDFFLVKAEVQLLLHNRQQIDPALSLRQNGCLMLKGDPYVKLVCAVKRGAVLNVVCHVRGGQRVRGGFSFPLACAEAATVWETKQLIARELFARQRQLDDPTTSAAPSDGEGPLNPHRVRLMWRYMELNDKATLHYYRVPTNAEMHVRFRKGPVAAYHEHTRQADEDVTGVRADLAHIAPQHFNDAVRVGTAAVGAEDITPLDVWQQQQQQQQQQQVAQQQRQREQQEWELQQRQRARPYEPATVPSASAALSARPVVCDVRAYAQPQPGERAWESASPYTTGRAVLPVAAASPELQLLSDSANATVVEVSALRRQTQWVTTELEALKQQYHVQQSQLLSSTSLRRELEHRSAQRIEQLEASMQHFQLYLERALRLIADGQ